MLYTSVITIDKSALANNIRFLKTLYGKNRRISSVIKANAYGHGIEQFIPICEETGIDHFSVFSSDEAYRAYQVKNKETDLMIMGWMDDEEMEWIISKGIEFYVFDTGRLMKAIEISKKINIPSKIHIELETGLNRTGFEQSVLPGIIEIINKNKEFLTIKGICTHYAGAESIANHFRVMQQLKKYRQYYELFFRNGIVPEYMHTACSAASITYPKTRMDLLRIGILQYGYWPSAETFIQYINRRKIKTDPLKRIITWKSKVMSVKKVNRGEFIGYGTTFLAQEDKTIAIIPIGYGHGYSRSLSNQGRVLIKGQRVGVIGVVNMNMLVADITKIPQVEKGDEVVLIGKQGELVLTIASFSELSNQLNYELLTRLPASIPREIVG
ncbi:MAG: alanine racemase [Bacteroidota bacterium]